MQGNQNGACLTMARLVSDRRGTSAIEFAIVANVFFMIIAGLGGFGVYLSTAHSLQQIAAEAARSAVAGVTQEEQQTFADSYIDTEANDYPFISRDLLTAAVSHPSPNAIAVTLSYDATGLPVLGMLEGLNIPVSTITASSTIRVGRE